jgi:hypothetical protein
VSLKKKLQDLAEKVVCGPDDDAALAEEIRKSQEEAAKKDGK